MTTAFSLAQEHADTIRALKITTGQERIHASSRARRELESVADTLSALASAFLTTGNTHMFETMLYQEAVLRAVHDKWHDLDGEASTAALQEARELNGAILGTALKVALNNNKPKET